MRRYGPLSLLIIAAGGDDVQSHEDGISAEYKSTVFDVYPLGYERIIPILRQFRDHKTETNSEIIHEIVDNLHNTPDFLLCLPDKTQVYLVEVKYRREVKPREI